MSDIREVVFVDADGAGSSQMAAMLLDRASGSKVRACARGVDPADEVHPDVRGAMAELGIALADHDPQPVDDGELSGSDLVVLLGEVDVEVPDGTATERWGAAHGLDLDAAPTDLRAELDTRVRRLLERHAPGVRTR